MGGGGDFLGPRGVKYLNTGLPKCNHKLKTKQKTPEIKMRLINDTTFNPFQALLNEEMWYQVYAALGTNEAFNAFQDILKLVFP
jgi:hypothetical protein